MPKTVSPFRYYGSKARLMPNLIPLFPPHQLYVSVFRGSGADIAHKPISQNEIYNDLNESLVTFFRVLQDRKQYLQLVSLVAGCPLSRAFMGDCHHIARGGHPDPVRRAFAVYYSTLLSFGGIDIATTNHPSVAVSSK